MVLSYLQEVERRGSKMNMFTANKSEETNQKPAGGFLIAHFKR